MPIFLCVHISLELSLYHQPSFPFRGAPTNLLKKKTDFVCITLRLRITGIAELCALVVQELCFSAAARQTARLP